MQITLAEIYQAIKEQQKCEYCHGDSAFIMNTDYEDEADIYVSGNTLKVSVIDTCGAHINYCPMCGRKLGND